MWSVQQQSMLNAMGYTLYARPGTQPTAQAPIAVATATPANEATRTDSALFKAIMNAAQGRDISALGIDVDTLRGSPQAKRALWTQLRRVMKS